jgi:hypothetical protein
MCQKFGALDLKIHLTNYQAKVEVKDQKFVLFCLFVLVLSTTNHSDIVAIISASSSTCHRKKLLVCLYNKFYLWLQNTLA